MVPDLSPLQDILVLTYVAWALPPVAGLVAWALGQRNAALGTGVFLWAAVAAAAAAAVVAFGFWGQVHRQPIHAYALWVGLANGPQFVLGVLVDALSSFMMALVAGVGALVFVFAGSCLKTDPQLHRFWALMGFFVFAMQGIVLADNLLLLFVFWELVGFASYWLIGFWHRKPDVGASSTAAFMVNRVADVAFLMAVVALLFMFTTTDFESLRLLLQGSTVNPETWQAELSLPNGPREVHQLPNAWLTGVGILVLVGVMGKSAQWPFLGWLPKAMLGPTPVSALLHAATMVAAGVFLLARTYPLFTRDALDAMAGVGAFTALFGAVAALGQQDLKRILAYSTISQLGYMVMAMGTMAYTQSLFHLLTHAFFKAGLFLAAGAVVHRVARQTAHVPGHDSQNILQMGGLRRTLPWAFWGFGVCAAALVGLPFTSGFLSKEGILDIGLGWAASVGGWAWGVPAVAFATLALTAFYTLRVFLLVFFAEWRGPAHAAHPSTPPPKWPLAQVVPVLVLAAASVWVWYGPGLLPGHTTGPLGQMVVPQPAIPFEGDAESLFETRANAWLGAEALSEVLPGSLPPGIWPTCLSLAMMALGGYAALRQFRQGRLHLQPVGRAAKWQTFADALSGLEWAYENLIIKPILTASRKLDWIDRRVVDQAVVWAAQAVAGRSHHPAQSPSSAHLPTHAPPAAWPNHPTECAGSHAPGNQGPSLSHFAHFIDSRILNPATERAAAGLALAGRWVRNPMKGRAQVYVLLMLLAALAGVGLGLVLF